MKNKYLKIAMVIFLLITLTMTNFIYVGASIVSYAVENITTSHKNIEFDAYLSGDNKIILKLNVKNEGYFTGDITLEKGNFKFKSVENQMVNKLEDNKITLNQLNAGTIGEIEVEIEPIKSDLFDIESLNMESVLKLDGTYRDRTEKDINVKSEKTIKFELPENNDKQNVEDSIEVITNKILKVSGEEKRIIQLLLNLGLKENNYPIYQINSKLAIPVINNEQPQVLVNATMNNTTEYNYKYENAILDLNMTNKADSKNNVLWNKTGSEKAIITLIYSKDAEIEDTKIDIHNDVELYNNKKLNTDISINLTLEEKDNIINSALINTEDSIYKGKMYSGIQRDYENTTKIDVNLIGVAKYIELVENPSTYVVNETNIDANIYYKQTIINKEQLLKVIGEDGSLNITTLEGNPIATVDASSATDEQGNMVIKYSNKIKGIKIQTSEPKNLGKIELNHTKTIEASEKEIIKSATAISTEIVQKYNVLDELEETYSKGTEIVKEQKIELKETITDAALSMNTTNLSTLSTNNVEMRAIFKSSNEQNDLYKSPTLKIIFPQEVQDVKVNTIGKVYADDFEFKKAQLIDEPGVGKIINIELVGEQKEYLNKVSQGINVVINADITFNKTTPSRTSEVIMKYTNKNGAMEEYETKSTINIGSQHGVFVYSKVSDFDNKGNVLETEKEGILEGKLNIADDVKVVIIERNIINNYEEKIEGINILGKLPEIGEKEINSTKLKSTFMASLQEVVVNLENAKIYYSEKADIIAESNEWQEKIEDITKIRAYKIELPNKVLEPGQVATIVYKLQIPAGLKYNESTYENVNISYKYKNQEFSKDYTTYLSTMNVQNPDGVVVNKELDKLGTVNVSMFSAGKELKDGQEIFEGQTVTVNVHLTNDTGVDLKNVKITAKQENGIFYTEKVTQEMNTQTAEQMDVTRIVEDETLKQKEFIIKELKNGESIFYEYQFSVKEKAGENTKGTIILEAEGIEEQEIETITNKIKDAKVKLNVRCNYNEERTLLAGSVYPITLSAKNISDKELKDVVLELVLPEGTSFEEIYLLERDYYTYLGTENGVAKFKVNSIPVGETVEIILSLSINEFEEDVNKLKTKTISTVDGETYTSNEVTREAVQEKAKITITQKGNKNVSVVKTGEEVIYTAVIKNESSRSQNIEITDNVPTAALVKNAYIVLNGNTIKINDIKENKVQCELNLEGNQEIQFVIETVIDENLAQNAEITNEVELNTYNQYIKSNAITYRLENIIDENIPVEQVENSISGKVWLDINRNGQMDQGEEKFANIDVKLLNATTGQVVKSADNKELKVKTNENGEYQFTKLEKDSYIVVIEYDTAKYLLTEYKKAGISEEKNSDVISKELDGKVVAVTDKIDVQNTNVKNINAGFVENKEFDLRIDKYINKVTIRNSVGTKQIEFVKAQLAKVEIDKKELNGSTILVEYGFDITNEGDVPGYVNEIIDYMPNDFKFNSEINKAWYTTTDENVLHNVNLINEVINPGETKTVILTLIKTLNENNIGISVNTVEIANASNNLMLSDRDSTPGNNAKGEDDISTAELIISIRTGSEVAITLIVIIVLATVIALLAVAIFLKKRRG